MIKKYKTVYGLLKNPSRWTRRSMSKDKNDKPCPVGSRSVKFCLLGAIQYVYGNGAKNQLCRQKIRKIFGNPFGSITAFNDNYRNKHDKILEVVKKAKI